MIHTPRIIETSAHIWRQLLVGTICNVEAYCLSGYADVDGLAELVFTMQSNRQRLHVSWEQEDGPRDDRTFYWLSLRNESHFMGHSLVPYMLPESELTSIANSDISSIRLYGNKNDDAVYASLIELPESKAFGMATTRWLANKHRFARCGSEELAVLSASSMNSLIADQRLDVVAEINR